MGPIATGMGQVLFYYLEDTTGTLDLTELRALQDWLVKFHLQTVPGVTEVLGIGGWEKQYQVAVRPAQLLRFGVTLADVIERVRANNLNVGAQFVVKDREEFVVRSVGLATGLDDLRSITVKTVDGRPVHLDEVAEVREGGAIRRGLQTRNGTGEVVAGQVIKLLGTNSSAVIARVEDRLEEINGILPEGVRVVPYYEQKTLVHAAVATVMRALLQGIALVVLVLLVFMGGVRPSLVAALSLPFSVLFAFLLMGRLGLSANLMSLGGLAIAIGMLVDGTIVVVENVDAHLRRLGPGASRRAAVLQGCAEVGRPIVFAIVIIILVFTPLLTLHGVEGKTFRPLAQTVVLAMLGSLVFAVVMAPVFASLLMRGGRTGAGGDAPREAWIVRVLQRPYRPAVAFLVRRRAAAVVLAAALLAVGAMVAPRLGSEFTPRLREGTVVARLTMAPSISLEESRRITMIVERRLLQVPEVREVVSRIGRGEVGAHTDPVNSAEMYVLLKPEGEWRDRGGQEAIEKAIRAGIGDVPGVLVNLTQPIEMTVDELLEGVRAELAVKIFGEDLDELVRQAGAVAAVVREVPGAADVQVDQVVGAPQLLVKVDRGAIARYGLNVADVQEVVGAAVGGETAGQVFEGVRRYDIVVRYEEDARRGAAEIARILVAAPRRRPGAPGRAGDHRGGDRPAADHPRGQPALRGHPVQRGGPGHRLVRGRGAAGHRRGGVPAAGLPGDLGRPVPPAAGGQPAPGGGGAGGAGAGVPAAVRQLRVAATRAADPAEHPPGPGGRRGGPGADGAEPVGARLGGVHRAAGHRPGERHGAGHLLQPAGARRRARRPRPRCAAR